MDKQTEKLFSKIRKMMAMAERTEGNEQEAANAARMVEKLLRKHNLTASDITPEQAKSNVKEESNTDLKWTASKCPAWVQTLAIAIGNSYDTFVVYRNAPTQDAHVAKRQQNLCFVGAELDVKVSLEMFDYLYGTIVRLSDEWAESNPAPKGKARTHKNSYRMGMMNRLQTRLVEMTKEKVEEYAQAGSALMVIKKDAIAEYLGRSDTEYASKKRSAQTNNSAYSAGHTAGGNVGLTKQMR